MKKGTFITGLVTTSIAIAGLVAFAVRSENESLNLFRASADTETYHLNSTNWDREIVHDKFVFTDKIAGRFDGAVGNCWVNGSDTTKAHVEVTKAGDAIWRGGMFVNTGVTMTAGKTYTVSLYAERAQEKNFEIVLQNKQWDEKKYTTLYTPLGKVETEFTVTEENSGSLWIYVQSGNATNEITISSLVIKESDKYGSSFNGIDGLHFIVNELDSNDAWRVKIWNNTAISVVENEVYKVHVDFKVDSLEEGKQLKFVNNFSNISGDAFKKEAFDYNEGNFQFFENTFTASSANPTIELQFGETEGAFHVVIKRIVVTVDLTGETLLRTNLESPDDFASKWNTANTDKALCSAEPDTVKALLRDYADLAPWARERVAQIDANAVDGYSGPNKVTDSINFMANRYEVELAA